MPTHVVGSIYSLFLVAIAQLLSSIAMAHPHRLPTLLRFMRTQMQFVENRFQELADRYPVVAHDHGDVFATCRHLRRDIYSLTMDDQSLIHL